MMMMAMMMVEKSCEYTEARAGQHYITKLYHRGDDGDDDG